MLAAIGDRAEAAVHDDLRPAVRDGLLLRQDDLYCFPHDRVRQAAYSLIGEEHRAGTHLRIGRLLHTLLGPDPAAEAVFEVANHLNLGAACLDDPQERIATARLNLLAADRARAAAAFAAALSHASSGSALLPPDSWASEHELAFSLALHQAEGEIIAGNLADAERLATGLLARAASRLERAKLHRLLVDVHTRRGNLDLALDSASQCLALYAVELPSHPSAAHVQTHEDAMRAQIANRSLDELRRLPRVSDPDLEAAMNVLAFILPTAYFSDLRLHRLVAIQLVTLTLRHGVMPASPMGFAAFGFELNISGRHAEAEGLGRLACDLVERHGFAASRAMVYLVAGGTTNAFSQPHRTSLAFFREALRAGLEVGDLLFASLASQQMTLVPFLTGAHLDELAEQAQSSIDFNRKARVPVFIPMLASIRNLARSLRRRESPIITSAGPDVDAKVFEEQIAPVTLPVVAFGYYLAKTAACVFGDDPPGALAAAEAMAGLMEHARGQLTQVEAHVLRALALAGALSHPATRASDRRARISEIRQHHDHLAHLASHCPANFASRHALVAAELARVEGRRADALDLYEQAIEHAREYGLIHYEALANELCARFHLRGSRPTAARGYLAEARAAYAQWGAEAKVQALTRQHADLLAGAGAAPGPSVALHTEHFDLLAVTKASQAISGHIVLEELIDTLVAMALEQGGAERGVLVLAQAGGLVVSAEATMGATGCEVRRVADEPVFSADLPLAILRFAWRTGQRVVLDAATEPDRFATDPYLARRRPRSALCLPIVRQAVVVGLLYLENNLAPAAFTPERLAALELLAGQAAISLENASLLRREQAARAVSEAAGRRAAFLSNASALLSESLDHPTVLTRLARLAVGVVADWCVIDVVEDGQIQRLAGAHIDPRKEPLLAELQRRYPPRWDSPQPAANVIRSGKRLLIPDASPELLRGFTVDAEHLRLMMALGTRSGMVVPLLAHGRTLGSITMGSGQASRAPGQADLELVEELARRAAIAIDNAQLFHQAQEAVRVRDEFLSVASHELNTPITAQMLLLESLLLPRGQRRDPEAVLRVVAQAERQGRRLTRLVSDLLDVTRMDRGEGTFRTEPVELGALVQEVVARFETELAQAACPVQLNLAQPVRGNWDRVRIAQIVLNLLANAAKFGAGQPIELRVEQVGPLARLSVTDHGPGIELPVQGRIFDRFVRGVSAQHYGGLGLGLYICRRIAEAHHGSIRVESQPEHGATFVVDLPCDS